MLVGVTGFGSVWRHRLGKQPVQSRRFVLPVYYNTTGVVVNGCVRQRPQVCGYARFDAVGGFDPNHPSRMINRVFECADPCVWMGYNKLLFRRMLRTSEVPHYYLVLARSQTHGNLQIGKEGWRSPDSWLLSLSEGVGQQEAMLLIPPDGWIQTDVGKFTFDVPEERLSNARLVLCNSQ